MRIEILTEKFDPWRLLADYESRFSPRAHFGAAAVFVGTMSDSNEGAAVESMHLEHYAGMTDFYLAETAGQVKKKYDVDDVLIVHRIGVVKPGDPIVVVAVWSRHRREAYAANREIMECLKARAPFWKKEQLAQGERWVDKNTPG